MCYILNVAHNIKIQKQNHFFFYSTRESELKNKIAHEL